MRIVRYRKRLPGCYGYDTVLWCPPGVVLVDAGEERARDSRGAVLFDFGGTLDADGVRWSIRFHAAYASGGGRLSIEAFDPLFSLSDRRLETHVGIRGLGLYDMIEAQVAILCSLLPDGSAMDVRSMTERINNESRAVVARNRPILADLHKRYRLGVVSNFTGNLLPCLNELAIADLFDAVTDSGVLGHAKPDPLPFTTTLEHLGVPLARAWMVGDNFQADIRPAQRLGMRTVWLAAADRQVPDGEPPTARIESLTDLPGILERTADAASTERERCMA
jgi:HAD superfamily hydrolase (TIGR01509 family)